nr:zinc ribbon domain-containing protein [Megasphaera elsdenii]
MDKWYPSSQLCHVCGYQNNETKDLSIREWDCPKCGSHHDRDKNAAINIREEARRISA